MKKNQNKMSDIYLVKGMELHFGIKSPPHTLAFFYDRSIENIFRKYCGKGVESTKEMIAELKEKNSIIIIAHPFMRFVSGIDEKTLNGLLESEKTKTDAIEWNCQVPKIFDNFELIFPYRKKVLSYSNEKLIPVVVGIDSVLGDVENAGYSVMKFKSTNLNLENPAELRRSFKQCLTYDALKNGNLKNVFRTISCKSFVANLFDIGRGSYYYFKSKDF